ncbi:unnamed protein product [Lactuca saligna]|uniref:Uncharacterized protein n=1 Tax=Lactuca saligna TaxID=75948 RepID=A0AA36E9C5_LACSI|nr:unnamed protein product [Lactuca saligna]
MKSKHKSRSPLMNVVRKPHVTHQVLLFRVIPAPDSPPSKKRSAADMAKHISKKKKKKKSKMIISSESTTDEDETIQETLQANLNKETSTPAQIVVIPPEDSVAKSVFEEARTSNILVNVTNIDANVIMGEDALQNAEQDNCRKKLQSLCFLTFQICSLVCGRINLIWVKFPIVQTLKEKNPKANDFLTFFWLTSCPTTDSQCIEHDYLGYPISLLVGETEWIEVLVFTL